MLRYMLHPVTLVSAGALALSLLLASFPQASLTAAIRGISIWWEVLFPALFPFFVISELLLGFGIVHFFGTLLDPLMRPLFRIPGSGGFVMTMGFVAGYPIGARLTAQLYEQKLIGRVEGERLVALTTSSDPIFLIGAVAVGFFHNAALVPVLASAHYGGSILIGLLMRFHGRSEQAPSPASTASGQPRLTAALTAMHRARLADGRPLGQLLSDAIAAALRLMMVVGGLVVFFSVMMEGMTSAGAIPILASLVQTVFALIGLPEALSPAVINGLFEVTLGVKTAASSSALLMHQTAIAAWVLSWGGLSVHAQVVSLLSRTGMRYKPFLLARFIHAFIATLLVYALWGWMGPSM